MSQVVLGEQSCGVGASNVASKEQSKSQDEKRARSQNVVERSSDRSRSQDSRNRRPRARLRVIEKAIEVEDGVKAIGVRTRSQARLRGLRE